MEFKYPFILLLLPVLVVIFYFWRLRFRSSSFQFPSTSIFEGAPGSWKEKACHFPQYLRWLALILLIIALASPRKVLDHAVIYSEGIDIVLTLDISGSMAAEDYVVNGRRISRVEIIKSVVKEFIDKRQSDRMGLVVFGSRAYTVCPLTTDYHWLKENLAQVRLGVIQDQTAIGSGIAQSLLRLKESRAKSRIIILLTDGGNNAGRIDPLAAGKMAKAMGVKVYTVGAGSNGTAPIPVEMFGQIVYQNIPV
ncbi:MAG: VWA domain-containing protein, partial [Candidatus Omnitrophota bacterium]